MKNSSLRFKMFIYALLFDASSMLFAFLISEFIDSGNNEKLNLNYIVFIGIIIVIIPNFFQYIATNILHKAKEKASISHKVEIFSSIINLDWETFFSRNKKDYVTNLVENYQKFQDKFYTQLGTFYESIVFVAVGFVFFIFQPVIVIVLACSCVLLYTSIYLFTYKLDISYYNKYLKANLDYQATLAANLDAYDLICTSNNQQNFIDEIYSYQEDLDNKHRKLLNLTSIKGIFNNDLTEIINIALIVLLSYLMVKNQTTVKQCFIIIFIFNNFVVKIADIFSSLISLKQANNILFHYNNSNNTNNKVKLNKDDINIEISNLSFGYDSSNIIENLNLKIIQNEKVLIVGESGTGKTTLIKLLLANITGYDGSIKYNGLELKDIDLNSLYENISIIDQDVYLLNTSIKNNITLFKNYSDEEILNAIKHANLLEFINSKSLGLDEIIVDNGFNISKGEKTRIAIARALLKKSKIIFADEITASLDNETSDNIVETLLVNNSTLIMISHKKFNDNFKFDQVIDLKGGI